MASALMESIERCSSLPSGWLGKFVRSSYSELSKTHKVLHPDKIVEPMRFVYHTNDDGLAAGHDLVSDGGNNGACIHCVISVLHLHQLSIPFRIFIQMVLPRVM